MLNDAIFKAGINLDSKESNIVAKIQEARNVISNSKNSLVELSDSTKSFQNKIQNSRDNLERLEPKVANIQTKLKEINETSIKTTRALNEYAEKLIPALNNSMLSFSEISTKTNEQVSGLSTKIQSAQTNLQVGLEQEKLILTQNKTLLENLKSTVQTLPEGTVKDEINSKITSLQNHITNMEESISQIEKLNSDINQNAKDVTDLTSQINTSAQDASTATLLFNTTLYEVTLPALSSNINQIGSSAQSLSEAIGRQNTLINQSKTYLDQLHESLNVVYKSVEVTNNNLDTFDSELSIIQTDINSISASETLAKIFSGGFVDSAVVGDFLGSPTKIETASLYNLNAYGSAMAPLFMNLTFWIGAFMLLVILRQEVDAEGIEKLTIAQRYIARWLLFSFFAALQAILCVVGVLWLGVQTVNVPALFFISCLASVTYLSIMFMLATTLQHIGKGLCVLLAFLQIPGATGLYPIEMTVPFFQEVYPFFPFTYGINGIRETICGFYGNEFLVCSLVLGLFLIISLFIGIYLRPYLTNFNKLFAKQIREGGIFVGEEIEIPTQRFRLRQLVGYISDREEYRHALEKRAKRFVNYYSKFKRYALSVGILLSLIIAVLFSRMPVADKPSLLSAWILSLIIIMLIVVLVEHAYDSLERQLNLDELSDEELKTLVSKRNKVGKTTSEVFKKQRAGRGRHYVKTLSFQNEQDKLQHKQDKRNAKKMRRSDYGKHSRKKDLSLDGQEYLNKKENSKPGRINKR